MRKTWPRWRGHLQGTARDWGWDGGKKLEAELELSRTASHLPTGGRNKKTAFFSFLPPSQSPLEPQEAGWPGKLGRVAQPEHHREDGGLDWGTIVDNQHKGHEVTRTFQLNSNFLFFKLNYS